MNHALLHYRDPDLPPEARVLLWQWIRVFGLTASATYTLRVLCQHLRITLVKGSRGMAQLKECGAIEGTSVPRQKGRPLTEYRIKTEVHQRLNPIEIEPALEEVLEGLIEKAASSGDGLREGKARKETLTLANSWLVAVLLAHMDRAGQVTTLSYTDLMALTGMSRSRVQSQIRKLSAMGVLHHQPGSMRAVMGTRPCSIFTLNLRHPQIHYASRPTWRLIFLDKKNRDSGVKNSHAVNGIVDAACVLACEARERGGIDSMLPTESPRKKVAAKAEPQHLRIKRDARRLLTGVSPWRGFHRLPVRPLQANWLRVYTHRYACWLLSQDHPIERGTKARLYRQLRQDFPQAATHEIKAVTALAHSLAKQLSPWVEHVLPSTKDAKLDDLALTPTIQDDVAHWQLSGRWHDSMPDNAYKTVPVSVESVKSDLSSELKRQSLL